MQNESTFNAPMLTSGKRFAYSCTTLAAILGGERRRNFPHSPPSFFRFGVEYRKESSPCRVTDAFGEMMILDHPTDVQNFDRDVVELSDQLKRDFVQEVEPLPLDSQMLLCQSSCSLSSVVAAAFLPTDGALRGLQSSFSLP